jgi:hypothetical protein
MKLQGPDCSFRDSAVVRMRIRSSKGASILRLPFPIFSDGLRGIALLWLRVAAASALVQVALASLTRGQQLSCIGIAVAAVFIGVGFLTPLFGLCAGLAEVVWMIVHPAGEGWSAFLVASILIALTVLGPGAYSIDRWLFGRKRLTIGRPPH